MRKGTATHARKGDARKEGDPDSSSSASDMYEDYVVFDDNSFYPRSCSDEHEWDFNEDNIKFIRLEYLTTISTCFYVGLALCVNHFLLLLNLQ